jgi:hypothetical protein
VTKLPDHDKKAKLTDLTMEDQHMGTIRGNVDDLEASHRSIKNKKSLYEEEKER